MDVERCGCVSACRCAVVTQIRSLCAVWCSSTLEHDLVEQPGRGCIFQVCIVGMLHTHQLRAALKCDNGGGPALAALMTITNLIVGSQTGSPHEAKDSLAATVVGT